jgi:AbiV family abortive infection protein
MAKSKHARALSLADIATFRAKLLENCASLISDAELLFSHRRYARTFALSVIAVEEASKILYLLDRAGGILADSPPDWVKVQTFLHSHHEKLKANLLNFKRLQSPSKVPTKGTADWEDVVARGKEMDALKQDGFYVSFKGGGLSNPDENFDEARAAMALKLAKISFNTSDLMGRGFDAKQSGQTQLDLRTRYPVTG